VRYRLIIAVLLVGLPLLAAGSFSSSASAATPAWTIRSLAQPTNFSPAVSAECAVSPESQICDSYTLLVTNVGNEKANTGGTEPIAVSDVLPADLSAVHIEGRDFDVEEAPIHCTLAPLRCVFEEGIPPGDVLQVTINVVVESGTTGSECSGEGSSRCVLNSAEVSGGGASAVATSEQTPLREEPAELGIKDFGLQALDVSGAPAIQAGEHPNGVTTSLALNTGNEATREGGVHYHSTEELRDVVINLPLGFAGNPQSTPRCPVNALLTGNGETACPAGSRIGTVVFEAAPGTFRASEAPGSETTAVYNMVPEAGFPAVFGFTYFGVPIFIYANVARTGSTYGLQAEVPGIPELNTIGTWLTLFGEPASHDGGFTAASPFFTDPMDCTEGSTPARVAVNSWQHPESWYFKETTVFPTGVVGCAMLRFQPTLKVQPETTRADEPSGYSVEIENPQYENSLTPGTPELRDVSVTLPPGMSISPSAADGLLACEATGPHGIDIPPSNPLSSDRPPDVAEEGETIGPDGLAHLAPGNCPAASTVATVEVSTPLLASPLQGHLYVAEPGCGGEGQAPCGPADASDGNLFGVYLEVAGSGVVVKLRGSASVNPSTGQLTVTFRENPQLPFSNLKVAVDGGPRAVLANPLTCSTATTTSDLAPWSAPITPDATPLSSFNVDWDGKGGSETPCPATPPFTPSLTAGTVSPTAGAFSPFTLTLSRSDRQQYLSRLSVTTPPGLLGMLSSVTLCPEALASRGACSAASEIGTTTAAVGPGSHPFWVTGHVYLTESYRGAPFGLSVVVPAKAGPFNLGDVNIRATINVDPTTSALTIVSEPLPQVIDGIPLRVQTINVSANRPNFTFNPTNCEAHQVLATATGAQGASVNLSSPFAAANCRSLPFSPKFTVSSQAKTSKKDGASLDVKVAYTKGQANIRSVAVLLPKQLPARLTTIQKACVAATFEANPAACPAASLIGIAKARTPVLPVLLSGPAYLVSHGGAAFPDVVVVLEGEGVRVDLTGHIHIAKSGVTSSTFASVPDAPITNFELNLPEGPHSALAATLPASAKGSLCASTLTMPTTLTGQNGLQVKQNTKIAVSSCPKAKPRKTKKAKTTR
jgi:hypothetical protein